MIYPRNIEGSVNTMRLVVEEGGFDYVSDTSDDDLPISTTGSECSTSTAPVITASASIAATTWMGLPEYPVFPAKSEVRNAPGHGLPFLEHRGHRQILAHRPKARGTGDKLRLVDESQGCAIVFSRKAHSPAVTLADICHGRSPVIGLTPARQSAARGDCPRRRVRHAGVNRNDRQDIPPSSFAHSLLLISTSIYPARSSRSAVRGKPPGIRTTSLNLIVLAAASSPSAV